MSMSCFFFKDSHFTSTPVDEHKLFTYPNTDSLMGCFFILKNGIIQYERSIHMNKDFDMRIKFECIDYITKKKQAVRSLNPRKSATDYIHILSIPTHIDLETFFMLCHVYELNITYIRGRFFYSTIYTNETCGSNLITVLCPSSDNKSYYLQHIPCTLIEWSNMYQVNTVVSPLPDINTMSKEQLYHIAQTFCMYTDPDIYRMTKKSLYDRVVSLVKLI